MCHLCASPRHLAVAIRRMNTCVIMRVFSSIPSAYTYYICSFLFVYGKPTWPKKGISSSQKYLIVHHTAIELSTQTPSHLLLHFKDLLLATRRHSLGAGLGLHNAAGVGPQTRMASHIAPANKNPWEVQHNGFADFLGNTKRA